MALSDLGLPIQYPSVFPPGVDPNAADTSATAAAPGAPPGGILSSVLGGGLTGGLSSIAQAGLGMIAQKAANNTSKNTASSMQQNFEHTALQIQDLVNSGAMDPGQAVAALKVLQSQALNLGHSGAGGGGVGGSASDPNMANAGQIANMTITNVLMNVQQKQTSQQNAPLNNGVGITGPNGTATNAEQLGRMGTSLRSFFTSPAGQDQGGLDPSSPLSKLIQPFGGRDPMDQAKGWNDQINTMAPPVTTPDLTQIAAKKQAQRF
jgi:hypothetical protein